ncbi:Magnesium transporter MRS2-3 [Spatholobus suberectus]|nr:Magnesium transporter MRS2-3 [Spatholobus suberectus]
MYWGTNKSKRNNAKASCSKTSMYLSTYINLERNRLVKSRLVALAARVRDELQHLLDDNEDMAELYLTEKIPPEISLERGGDSASDHEDDQNAADYSRDQMFGASNGVGSEIHETQAGSVYSAVTKHDVEELEMLLGAYFVQIGSTLNKLSRLRVKLSTASVLLNAFICVTAVFGMNIHIGLFDTGMPQFLGTIFGGTVACIFLYVVAIIWYKCKDLVD